MYMQLVSELWWKSYLKALKDRNPLTFPKPSALVIISLTSSNPTYP